MGNFIYELNDSKVCKKCVDYTSCVLDKTEFCSMLDHRTLRLQNVDIDTLKNKCIWLERELNELKFNKVNMLETRISEMYTNIERKLTFLEYKLFPLLEGVCKK